MASYPGGPGWEHYRDSLPKAIDSLHDRHNRTSSLDFFERARLGAQIDALTKQKEARIAHEREYEQAALKKRELDLKEREIVALEILAAAQNKP